MASKAKRGNAATRARPRSNKARPSASALQWYRGPNGNIARLPSEVARHFVGLTPIAPPTVAQQRRRYPVAPPLDPGVIKAVRALDRAMQDVLRTCRHLDRLGIPQELARDLLLNRADLHWKNKTKPIPFEKVLTDPEQRRVRGSSVEADYSRSAISKHWTALIKAFASQDLRTYYRLMSKALSYATAPATAPTTPTTAAQDGAGGFLRSVLGRSPT